MKKVILIIVIIGILVAGFAVIGSQRFLDDLEDIISFVPSAKFGGITLNTAEELYATKLTGLSYNQISGKYQQTTDIDTELLGNYRLLSDDGNIVVSEYDVVTLDIDITYESSDVTMFGVLSYNQAGKLTSSKNGYSKFLYLVSRDDGSCALSVMDSGTYKTLAVVDDSFHLTIVYKFSHHDYTMSLAYVYVDGVYIGEIPNYTSSDLYSLNRIRIQQSSTGNSYTDDQIGLSNLVINGFERDYDGAIIDALEDPSIDLQDCPDSVLYRS